MGYPDFSKISNYDQSFSLCFRSSPPLAYSRTRFQSSFFSLMSSYSSSLLGHSMQHMNIFLLFIFSFINSLIIEKKTASPKPTFPSSYYLGSLHPFRAKLFGKEHTGVFNKWYQLLRTPSNMKTKWEGNQFCKILYENCFICFSDPMCQDTEHSAIFYKWPPRQIRPRVAEAASSPWLLVPRGNLQKEHAETHRNQAPEHTLPL